MFGGGGGGFGSKPAFGQPAQQNTSFTFGAQNNQQQQPQQGTGFGGGNTGGAFSFGGQNNQQQGNTSTFGAPSTTFGQPAQQQQQGGGIFGSAAPARPAFGATGGSTFTGGFGAATQNNTGNTFGASTGQSTFGSNTSFGKPSTTLGGTNAFGNTGTFGSNNANAGAATTGGGIFGSNNATAGAATTGGGIFGSNTGAVGGTSSVFGGAGTSNTAGGMRYSEMQAILKLDSKKFGEPTDKVDRLNDEKKGTAVRCLVPTVPINLGMINDQHYSVHYPTYTELPQAQVEADRFAKEHQRGSTVLAYQPSWWTDPAAGGFFKYHEKLEPSTVNPAMLYHSISAMAPYRDVSFEELHWHDRQNNVPAPTAKPPGQEGMMGLQHPRVSPLVLPSLVAQRQVGATLSQQLEPAAQNHIRAHLELPPAPPGGVGVPAAASGSSGGMGNTTGGFGSTSTGFGATGTTTGFGASANPSLGFGQSGNTNTQQPGQTSLFGGANTNNTATGGTSLFGQPAQNNTFGGGGFGAANNQQQQQTTGFGATSGTTNSLFGAPKPATGFGSTSTGFGAPANTGTGSSVFGQPAQPATNAFSFGSNNQQQGQQGQTGGFAFGSNSTNNTFGANNQQQQQPAAGGFGFGQPQQTNQNSLFGGAAKPATTTGFGGFGAATNTATTSFGQNNQQQPASTGFSFGGTNNNANTGTGTGLFGANNSNAQPAAGTNSLFGAANNNTANNTGTGAFGFGSTAPKPATTTTFGFGQPQIQQQQQGQQGQQPAAGGFSFGGAANNNATNNTAGAGTGNLFGNTASTGTSLFGAKPATTTFGAGAGTTGSTSFGFGSTANNAQGQNQQQPQQQQSSIFGGGGGGFGAQNAGTGTTGTGVGMFGNTAQQQQQQSQQPGNSLFGSTANKPGLFGSTTTNTGGTGTGFSFGNNSTTATGTAGAGTGGFGFGGGNSLFGSNNQQSMLQQQQQQQQPLTASVDQNAYGNSALFASQGANGAPGAAATAGLDTSFLIGKKPALPPLSASFRSTPRRGQVDKLRGFASPVLARSSSGPGAGSPLHLSGSLGISGSYGGRSTSSPAPTDRYRGLSDTVISPTAFVPRPSIKRLNVTPRLSNSANGAPHNPADPLESVLGKSAIRSPAPSPAPQRQRLDGDAQDGQSPHVSRLSRYQPRNSESHNGDGSAQGDRSNADANGTASGSSRRPQQDQSQRADRPSRRAGDDGLQDGDYWCRPPVETLRRMDSEELSAVDFTAGRKGVGQAHWNEPVNFNGIDLDTLLGGIITFENMAISVYPDDEQDAASKPPVGKGLNMPTSVQLENVYSTDKQTGEPIKDTSSVGFTKFLKRLQVIPETRFIDYQDGVWKFEVDHFSRYAFVDSDDDAEQDGGDAAQAHAAAMRRKRALASMRDKTRKASARHSGAYHDAFDRDQPDQDQGMPPRAPTVDGSEDDFLDMPPSKGLRDTRRHEEEEEQEEGEGDQTFDSQQTDESEARESDMDGEEEDEEEEEEGEDSYHSHSYPASRNGLHKSVKAGNSNTTNRLQQMRGMFSSIHSAPVDPSALKRKAGTALIDFDAAAPASGQLRSNGHSAPSLSGRAAVSASRREQDFRSAEEDRDALDARAAKRSSFGGKTASPPLLRQPRKYARVPLGDSIVGCVNVEGGAEAEAQEGVRLDAGLALGRSFRCSWGPNGELVHFGKIGGVKSEFTPAKEAAITIQPIDMLAAEDAVERAKADKLLTLHLERSVVSATNGIPVALIDSDIRFNDFAARFDSGDRSHEANLFRLGVALFDEIDLRLPDDSPEELVLRISEVRRKLALSRWLEDAVAPAVDAELTTAASRPAKVFTLLTGNQVDRAVQSAIEGNDLRLATLLAQIGGPNNFRDEVQRQLNDWQHYKSTSLISPEYRRIYALLAGITDLSPGDTARSIEGCADVKVSQGLDWKRALGVRMWYADRFEDDISTVMDSYSAALQDKQHQADALPAKPIPEYLEMGNSRSEKRWKTVSEPSDILYGLIRLYADNTISLEEVLNPSDASASPADVRLLWHLYMLLSKVLQKRDFADRIDLEGWSYSAKADALTQAYAAQLERVGSWLDAAFVLLHLETGQGRELAIRDLLFRHASMTPQQSAHLTEKLCTPAEWVHQAKAARMCATGNVFAEYHELAAGKLYDAAHTVLVRKLVPEAILRQDLQLVERLCAAVASQPRHWEYRGKLFADYVDIALHLDETILFVSRPPPGSLPAELTAARERLAAYKASIPRLLQLLPGVFTDKADLQSAAALSYMLKELSRLANAFVLGDDFKRPGVSRALMDADRLHLLQVTARDSFVDNLGTCVAAV